MNTIGISPIARVIVSLALIVESCANKPVASLEAAGSFVITLPMVIGNDTYFRLVTGKAEMTRDNENLLYLMIRPVDSVWVYRLGGPLPIRRLRLPIAGLTLEDMTFDVFSKRLCIVCEPPSSSGLFRILLRYNVDLSLCQVDTLPPLRDGRDVEYVPLPPTRVIGNTYRTSVAAVGEYRQFVTSASIAQYDLTSKKWSFIHRRPSEIQEDTIRPFLFPLLADRHGADRIQYLRYEASDSLYRVNLNGRIEKVTPSAPSIVDFHTRLPERQYTSSLLYATEPHLVYYNYLPEKDIHVSIAMNRQSERILDGRLADEGTAKYVVQFFNDDLAEVLQLPSGLVYEFPSPLVLGDRMAFLRRSRKDKQEGRMTFAMYRIAMK